MKTNTFAGTLMLGFALAVLFAVPAVADGNFSDGNFSFSWKIEGSSLVAELSAPTTGWISVGFGPTRIMKDADMYLFAVTPSGEVVAEDHFGTGSISHKKDVDIGGTSDVTVLSGSEKDGVTTVRFSIPLNSGDEYDAKLEAGKSVKAIFASSAKDSFTSKHNKKGKGDMIP
ncbi:DOMON domain-containing protein [Treponema zuelzerae]|uniref:DOMON domain-containing protein n=1 Tax=Teretinema zuelzerae TaxID=156 RepID=A0AAE3JKV3_9SPIR|nr:DOMON domain-containing protein [Teretinema zuelzerae]MBN2811330.1 DOMON domain-containing protein [Spirochaetales bacterium]MCD1654269.1 DOMON domain-containing protein [Teretinema zuelzerae]